MVTAITALLNGLGAVLPLLPGLVNELKGTGSLTADGKALLDALADQIQKDEKAVDATPAL